MSVDDASGNIEKDTHAIFGLANEQITLPNCFAAKKARLLRARKFEVCLHFFNYCMWQRFYFVSFLFLLITLVPNKISSQFLLDTADWLSSPFGIALYFILRDCLNAFAFVLRF